MVKDLTSSKELPFSTEAEKAVLGGIMLWLNKKNFTTQIPFGPYIIAATFIYILIGPQVIAKTEKMAMYFYI